MQPDVTNLGELERTVLEYVWNHGECDVKAAHAAIGRERKITHNTVQSTFKRLWEKGLLSRWKEGHAYVYAPRVDRAELTELLMSELVDEVAGDRMQVALEAFVNLAERTGEGTLEQLEELVAARRKLRDKRGDT